MTDRSHESMVYRFKGLIHAIEFFSQRFDAEQIVQYAVDFIDELMIVDKVAVIIEQDGYYVPVRQRMFEVEGFSMEATRELKDIVVLHAGLFFPDDLKRLFPEELYENFKCKMGIPLIMDKKLFGFILLDRLEGKGVFDSDDRIFATALMNLYYTALTNYQSYDELIRIKKRLDEKIFNLFAINQSSKVLLSTLEIEDICSLSISIFSELTQSSVTSMFMYDEISEAYRMMAVQNVFELNQKLDMTAYQTDESVKLTYKSYFDMNVGEERTLFINCFHNGELILDDLKPLYVVPVYKNDHLLGFITLGKRVNDAIYNDGIIELVESLSSSLYVSISNAKQVKIIQEQKQLIDSKLQKLMVLNSMIKNINTSSSFENLMGITRDTLALSFDVKCGMIAEYDSSAGTFITRETIGCDKCAQSDTFEKVFDRLSEGKVFVANSVADADRFLGKEFTKRLGEAYAGALLIPIYLDKFELELLGVICIFDVNEQIIGDQVNALIYESIANAIAPVWYQLGQMKVMKEQYIKDGSVTFKQQLEEEMTDADDFELELYVISISYDALNCLDRSADFYQVSEGFKKAHRIDNSHMMVISGLADDERSVRAMLDKAYHVEQYEYKKDFSDYKTFLECLS